MSTLSKPASQYEIPFLINRLQTILVEPENNLPGEAQRVLKRASELIDWSYWRVARLESALRAFCRSGLHYSPSSTDNVPSPAICSQQPPTIEEALQLLSWLDRRIGEFEDILIDAVRRDLRYQPSAGSTAPPGVDRACANALIIYNHATNAEDIRSLLTELQARGKIAAAAIAELLRR